MPPTTPPATAPTGVEEVVDSAAGVVDPVAVGRADTFEGAPATLVGAAPEEDAVIAFGSTTLISTEPLDPHTQPDTYPLPL